jgi:septum formation protein
MDILLASNSPRRMELLSLAGWHFKIHPAQVDEQPFPGEQGEAYVLRLSEMKARAAAPQAGEARLVVAADTTVVDQGEILGKPQDESEAFAMLRRLRSSIHQVYTAVAVLEVETGELLSDLCCTDVPMRDYSHEEMQAYVASGDPLDKAGGYAIQHAGFHPVEDLQGCFANVMGLPLCHLVRTLRKLGKYPPQDVPQACQAHLDYACPVYKEIL